MGFRLGRNGRGPLVQRGQTNCIRFGWDSQHEHEQGLRFGPVHPGAVWWSTGIGGKQVRVLCLGQAPDANTDRQWEQWLQRMWRWEGTDDPAPDGVWVLWHPSAALLWFFDEALAQEVYAARESYRVHYVERVDTDGNPIQGQGEGALTWGAP